MVKKSVIILFWAMASCVGGEKAKIPMTGEAVAVALTPEIPSDSVKGAYLWINNPRYNFGEIDRSITPKIDIDFEIKNIGKEPLVIIKGDVSCGCLSVEYSKEPILPGGVAQLVVKADLKNQEGIFDKTIFIKSNAENDVALIRIKGDVE